MLQERSACTASRHHTECSPEKLKMELADLRRRLRLQPPELVLGARQLFAQAGQRLKSRRRGLPLLAQAALQAPDLARQRQLQRLLLRWLWLMLLRWLWLVLLWWWCG